MMNMNFPAYCVLNLCRLMYSFETGDVVVSKRASATWADAAFPEWRSLIQAARNSYDRQATLQDRELLKSKAKRFFEFAGERIEESRGQAGNARPGVNDKLRNPQQLYRSNVQGVVHRHSGGKS